MSRLEMEVVKAMKDRGFLAKYAKDAGEAREAVLAIVKGAKTIGIGGSLTIADSGIFDALEEAGYEIYNSTVAQRDNVPMQEMWKKAFDADVYMLSANAVTEDGALLNIDGSGNRVAASIYGPKTVIFVVSKNKIAKDYGAAMQRMKEIACPKNAARLNKKTPCAVTGVCADCHSADRICNVTVIHERPTMQKEVHVVLIDEEYGL